MKWLQGFGDPPDAITGTPDSCLGVKGQAQHGAQRRLVLESPLSHLPGKNAYAFDRIGRFECGFLEHRHRSLWSEHSHTGEQALLGGKVSVGRRSRDLTHRGDLGAGGLAALPYELSGRVEQRFARAVLLPVARGGKLLGFWPPTLAHQSPLYNTSRYEIRCLTNGPTA